MTRVRTIPRTATPLPFPPRRATLLGLFGLMVLVSPRIALAQTADVGLSVVRAQRLGRSDLPNANAGGGDAFGFSFAVGDFDGDGVDDLATGVPGSDGNPSAPVDGCGQVVVRYGIAGAGLDADSEPTALRESSPAVGDQFGASLAACDFNGDHRDDLVVGVPGRTVVVGFDLFYPRAGIVEIYYGTNEGIVSPSNTRRREYTGTIFPTPEARFGAAVACADFNADGYDDLAVGIPQRDLGAEAVDAGRINVFSGSISGLGTSALALDQDSQGMQDVVAAHDTFGSVLAAGDFDGNSYADLAIGVPNETVPSGPFAGIRAGAVHVVSGGAAGLDVTVNVLLPASIVPAVTGLDRFGSALAVGNFDADSYDDLAIGSPSFDLGPETGAGFVLEVFGHPSGLGAGGGELFTEDSILGDGASQADDLFARALAAGDFDGDGADDLAAGSPGEDVLGTNEGAVTILRGLAGFGLVPAPNRHRHLNHGVDGVPGDAEEDGLQFGDELTAGDFDDDGFSDLAIGAPVEDENELETVGSLTILYGALFADGFETGGMDLWNGDPP